MEAEDAIDLDEEDVADESTQQSQSQPEINGVPLQDIGGNKRPAEEDTTASQERPPAKQRRTREIDAAFSRPTSIGQVRESLSFLLDEPDQVLVGPSVLEEDSDLEIEDEPTESGADLDEDDFDDVAAEEARQNDGGFAPNPKSMEDKALMPPPPRRPGPLRRTAAKPAVVDRLSLKRGISSSASADSRSAWSSGGSTASSKAQSLLRRATTSLSSSGANDRGVTTGGGGNDRGVTIGGGARVGGNKKSSLAYQARAEERRTIVEASARRRAENTAKIAELRRANSSSMARIGFAGNGFE
jgi:mediator of replication checkpoint protein 1